MTFTLRYIILLLSALFNIPCLFIHFSLVIALDIFWWNILPRKPAFDRSIYYRALRLIAWTMETNDMVQFTALLFGWDIAEVSDLNPR